MYEDSPSSRLYESMMASLYVNHGIRTNICGSVASIAEITPELLLRCHRAFYRPENMVLIVVGDITTEAVLALLEDNLPSFEPAPTVHRVYPEEPDVLFGKKAEFHMDISRPKVCLGIKDTVLPKTAKLRERRALAANLLCDLYFGESTPFYERLYREGVISRDFSAYYESITGCAHLLFSGATDDPERLITELRNELRRIAADPVAEEADFIRIRNVHYAEFVKDFDSTEDIACALLDAVLDGTELFDTGEELCSLTLSEIRTLAKELLGDEEKMATSVILPMKGDTDHA